MRSVPPFILPVVASACILLTLPFFLYFVPSDLPIDLYCIMFHPMNYSKYSPIFASSALLLLHVLIYIHFLPVISDVSFCRNSSLVSETRIGFPVLFQYHPFIFFSIGLIMIWNLSAWLLVHVCLLWSSWGKELCLTIPQSWSLVQWVIHRNMQRVSVKLILLWLGLFGFPFVLMFLFYFIHLF